MPTLADLRVLVLAGSGRAEDGARDLQLLESRTTAHVLPVARNAAITIARVAKRLLLGQDDLIVLYRAPGVIRTPVSLLARAWRKPLLAVGGRARAAAADTSLLRSLAGAAGRRWPDAGRAPVRLDVGCGSVSRPGFIGLDGRRTQATAVIADARGIPIKTAAADEVYASCLLEHFDDPHEVLRQIHRVLRPDGQAVLRLPNLGTYSAHLDTTHRFLADLALWKRILGGYFEEVRVVPVGTKYRDNAWLLRLNWVAVHLLKWHELAQGWDFICRGPRAAPSVEYTGWWEE